MVEQGQILKVKTETKNDVFGTCWYEVVETGLPSPEKAKREAGVKDGVKCVLLAGSGPAARPGYSVIDSQERITANMKSGVTEVVSRDSLPAGAGKTQAPKAVRSKATGCVEVD
jgi:hypothetical protein